MLVVTTPVSHQLATCDAFTPHRKYMEAMGETPSRNQSQHLGNVPSSNGHVVPDTTPVSPPYWQHQRSVSYASNDSNARPVPISLEDHTEAHSETSGALWARHITMEDYVIVRGGSTGIGAYVVWICRVETLNVAHHSPALTDISLTSVIKGAPMMIRKRWIMPAHRTIPYMFMV